MKTPLNARFRTPIIRENGLDQWRTPQPLLFVVDVRNLRFLIRTEYWVFLLDGFGCLLQRSNRSLQERGALLYRVPCISKGAPCGAPKVRKKE